MDEPTRNTHLRDHLTSALRQYLHLRQDRIGRRADPLERIRSLAPRSFFIGGFLRDIFFEGTSARPRDIDIVVFDVSDAALQDALSPWIRRTNRFGGHVLSFEGESFDVWCAQMTHGVHTHSAASIDPAAMAETTPFTIEAILASLGSSTRSAGDEVYEAGFFKSASDRSIDWNCLDNALEALSIARAITFRRSSQFSMTKRFKEQLLPMLCRNSIDDIDRVGHIHYGVERWMGRTALSESLDTLFIELSTKSKHMCKNCAREE